MTHFEVDVAQVDRAGGAVQASASAIATEVDAMMRHLVELQASWKGPAAASFQQVITDWRTTQDRVRAGLDEIRRALGAAGRQYADVEQAAVRLFAG
ncbi:MAG TPA: WXG100 family type VII secretion target [Kineosporiaceae bacterium]|nr:WXG100 family type VII secretion target [Kineosporiaceae bacterium]